MSRLPKLAQLSAAALVMALVVGCERSSTGPAPAATPSFSFGHAGDDAQLLAPQHTGGKKSDTFGKNGGRLHFDDATAPGIEYWLDVPAGAVRTSTKFEMEVLPGDHYLVSLKASSPRGDNDVGKAGFGQPVRLTISYSTAKHPTPPPHMTVAWLPDGGGDPVPMKTQVNPGQKTVTGYLPHFSKYTVIYW